MGRVDSPAEGNQAGPGSGNKAGQEGFRGLPVPGVDRGGGGTDHQEVGEEVKLVVIGSHGLDGLGHQGKGTQSLAAGQEPFRVEAEPEGQCELVRRRPGAGQRAVAGAAEYSPASARTMASMVFRRSVVAARMASARPAGPRPGVHLRVGAPVPVS